MLLPRVFARSILAVTLAFAAVAEPRLSAIPQESAATLQLEVVDEEGGGLSDILVLLVAQKSPATELARGSTDRGGRLTLRVPVAQASRIHVRPYRRGSRESIDLAPMAAGEVLDQRIAVRTRPDLLLRRQVVWADTGDPVANAGIAVFGVWDDYQVGQPADARTDASGYFSVRVKSWETHYGVVFGEGLAPVGVLLTPTAESPGEEPIPVQAGASMHGTVRSDGADGLSVVLRLANADLPFVGREVGFDFGTDSKALEYRTAVRPDGTFELWDLPADALLSLRVQKGASVLYQDSGYSAIDAGQTAERWIELEDGAVVRGTLVDESGSPVPDYPMGALRGGLPGRILMQGYSFDRELRTEADGSFEMFGLGPGTWHLGPIQGGGRPGIGASLPVVLDGEDVEVTVPLYAERFVSGRVRLSTGEPADIHVLGRMAAAFTLKVDKTAADGSFRVGPFPPGTVRFEAQTGVNWPYRFQAGWEPIDLAAGASDVELTLRPGGGLAGTAVDALTLEPVRVFLRLESLETQDRRVLGRGVAPQPEFELWSLVPGEYQLFASTVDGRYAHRTERVEALRSVEGRELRLKAGGFVEVRNASDHPFLAVSVCSAKMTLHGVQVPKNQTQRLTVPPGEVTIDVASIAAIPSDAPALEQSRTFQVAVGETANMEVK